PGAKSAAAPAREAQCPTRPTPPGGGAASSATALSCLLGAVLILSARTAVQIGADEGFELAKATLCLKGHKLYGEVWNDQPPLHTTLVAEALKLAGEGRGEKG